MSKIDAAIIVLGVSVVAAWWLFFAALHLHLGALDTAIAAADARRDSLFASASEQARRDMAACVSDGHKEWECRVMLRGGRVR